jgi:beta-lactamase superfamily II metal-dependent hydrolase
LLTCPPSSSRFAALLLGLLVPALVFAQELRLTMVDVGQGDSLVLVAPGGCAALFDAGPTGSGTAIKSYLRSLGVTRLDMAFASHYHEDHIGGMDEVDSGADAVPIATVYDRGGSFSTNAFNEYRNRFSTRRRTALFGQVITLCSQVRLEVVAVNANGVSTSDENARSVVVKVSYGAFDALIGGDLTGNSPDIESRIASAVGELEVYKVHHHGSDTSSNTTFLNATRPTVSLIPVGLGNSYGHPTPACLQRLAAVGSEVWQTADNVAGVRLGHIALTSTNGDTYTVSQGSARASYSSKGVAPDTQPPSAPGSLVATAPSATEVDLSWSASTDNVGVSGYRVYRSTNGSTYSLAGTATTTAFSDMGLAATTLYYYRVTAVDGAQNESAPASTSVRTGSGSPRVILNEMLANEPGSDTAGEFVELTNVGSASADLSGWQLLDATGVRHTFAAGTTLAPGKALVVFGGATAIPGGLSNAVAASTGTLSLNNTSDTVTVRNTAGATVDGFSYGSALASTDGVSMNRSPDASSTGSFVLHTSLSLLSSSAGVRANGSAF